MGGKLEAQSTIFFEFFDCADELFFGDCWPSEFNYLEKVSYSLGFFYHDPLHYEESKGNLSSFSFHAVFLSWLTLGLRPVPLLQRAGNLIDD